MVNSYNKHLAIKVKLPSSYLGNVSRLNTKPRKVLMSTLPKVKAIDLALASAEAYKGCDAESVMFGLGAGGIYKHDECEKSSFNWTKLFELSHMDGMSCLAFSAPGGINVMSFCGTEKQLGDFASDFQYAATNVLPWQFSSAELAFNKLMNQYGKFSKRTILTGHSLGGILAKLVGWKHGIDTLAFNAPSIGGKVLGGQIANHKKTNCKIQTVIQSGDPVGALGFHAIAEEKPIRIINMNQQCHKPGMNPSSEAICYHGIKTVISSLSSSPIGEW